MGGFRKILSILCVCVGVVVGGVLLQRDVNAYFEPQVKQSNKGNWMQCYALQYSKKTGGGTALGGAEIGHVASTERICSYVDSDGNMITGKIGKLSEPSGTASFLTTLKGSGNAKVFFELKNDNTIEFHQCNDGSAGTSCASSLAKSWTAKKGESFEKLAKEINDFANDQFGDYTKMEFGNNSNTGTLTQELSTTAGTNGDDGGDSGSSYEGDPCYNADANSMGWILCPAIRNMEYTATSMDNLIDGWLTVDTELYNATSPTATVWEIMRNIANVIMVIILLVIIFSQLTGVGIDNYGIKKMLPRIIAMAVLINLSLVVCEIAVDISNLLGTGLRNLFGGIGQSLLANRDVADYMESFVSTMVTVLMASVGIAGAVAPTGLAVASVAGGGSTMIIILIALLLLIVVAALMVFFVMLGARMIIIIGCIAAAPIAFALYILPNTQIVFKKWWNIFKTALLIFPICGAVGGISWIIKAIVLTSDEIHIWMGVVGIISPFLVFFMLPMMLRGVMGTLGKVGEALNAMGQGVRGGARNVSGAVQNSDRFKDAMKYARDTTSLSRARRTQDRLRRRGLDNLNARQQNRFARAANIEDQVAQQRIGEREAVMMRQYGGMGAQQLEELWNTMADDENTNSDEFQALTNYRVSRYGAAAVNNMAQRIGEMNAVDGPHAEAHRARLADLQQTRKNNKNFADMMRNKAPDADEYIANGGQRYNETTGQMEWTSMDHYTRNQNTATAAKDWTGASRATLERSVGATNDSGDYVMSTRMLEEMLNSDDPAIKSGLASEDGKYEQIAGEYYNRTHGTNLERGEAARRYDEERRNAREQTDRRRQETDDAILEIRDNLRNNNRQPDFGDRNNGGPGGADNIPE